MIENYLPVPAVDPYCLYSEGNKNIPASDFFTMRQLLSVEKYMNFRKQFNNFYSSIINFYNQFADIPLARINKQDLNAIINPRLAIYSAAKAMYIFQHEYASLFSEYGNLNNIFIQQETERMLTLVNIWRHVLDNPPKQQAIAYPSKQRYRKGITLFKDLISKIPSAINGTVFETENYIYLATNCNTDNGNTLESEYTNLVLKLRDIFKSAVLESSDRWYCETQNAKLAYIPVIAGVCAPTAFLIPFYKLFDTEKSKIAEAMFPCEIEANIKDKLFDNFEISVWITAMHKIQEIKLYLKRFGQIIKTEPNKECAHILELFVEKTATNIQLLWNEFLACQNIVDELIIDAEGQDLEMLNCINTLFNCYDEIVGYIHNRGDTEKMVQILDTISTIMLFLQPLVIKNCS